MLLGRLLRSAGRGGLLLEGCGWGKGFGTGLGGDCGCHCGESMGNRVGGGGGVGGEMVESSGYSKLRLMLTFSGHLSAFLFSNIRVSL